MAGTCRAWILGGRVVAACLASLVFASACMPLPERGTLVLAIESRPLTLDPRGAFNADTAHVQQLVFNTLVTKGPNFDFAPELAERWVVAPDFRAHEFRLRPGVRFHDGAELSSADVVDTFGSLMAGSFAKSPAFAALERVEAVDDLTVRFVSRRPNPGLLVDLIAVGVLRAGSGEEAATAPIGTGPFRVASFDRDGDLLLEAFDGYFNGRPPAPRLRVRVVADPATREAALAAGEVDLAINTQLSPEALERLAAPDANTRVLSSPGGGVKFVALNVEAEPLRDPRVRRALAHAVDRESVVAALLGGRAIIASGPLPPGHWARAEIAPVPFDPNASRRLLAETGARPAVELMVVGSRADVIVASVIQEAWRAIGVETRIVEVEPAVFFERLTYGDFGAALHGFTGGNQFTTIFKGAFHSRAIHRRGQPGGEINYARFADRELDALIDEADLERDPDRQRERFHQVQRHIAEAAPWIFLWHSNNTSVLGARVADFEVNRGGDFYALRTGVRFRDR